MEEMSGASVTSTMNMVNDRISHVRNESSQTVKFNQDEANNIVGSLLHLSSEIVELKQEIADIMSSNTAQELSDLKAQIVELKQEIEDLFAEGEAEDLEPEATTDTDLK